MREDKELLVGCAGTILIIGICLCTYLFGCYMESSTYNKLTGAKTTTWDAMWVELRVQDGTEK